MPRRTDATGSRSNAEVGNSRTVSRSRRASGERGVGRSRHTVRRTRNDDRRRDDQVAIAACVRGDGRAERRTVGNRAGSRRSTTHDSELLKVGQGNLIAPVVGVDARDGEGFTDHDGLGRGLAVDVDGLHHRRLHIAIVHRQGAVVDCRGCTGHAGAERERRALLRGVDVDFREDRNASLFERRAVHVLNVAADQRTANFLGIVEQDGSAQVAVGNTEVHQAGVNHVELSGRTDVGTRVGREGRGSRVGRELGDLTLKVTVNLVGQSGGRRLHRLVLHQFVERLDIFDVADRDVNLGVLVDSDVHLAGHDVLRCQSGRQSGSVVRGEAGRALDGNGQAVLVSHLVLELAGNELARNQRVFRQLEHGVGILLGVKELVSHS